MFQILKVIGLSFFTSSSLFILLSIAYNAALDGIGIGDGNLDILYAFYILIVLSNLLSFFGYLNLIMRIAKTKYLSIGTFIILPLILLLNLLGLCVYAIKDGEEGLVALILILPIILQLISLLWFSNLFLSKHWK